MVRKEKMQLAPRGGRRNETTASLLPLSMLSFSFRPSAARKALVECRKASIINTRLGGSRYGGAGGAACSLSPLHRSPRVRPRSELSRHEELYLLALPCKLTKTLWDAPSLKGLLALRLSPLRGKPALLHRSQEAPLKRQRSRGRVSLRAGTGLSGTCLSLVDMGKRASWVAIWV